MRHTAVSTDIGEVWFSAGALREGPAVFLLHGALRSTEDLAQVASRLPNVVLGHLPGHGVGPLAGGSVDIWSRAFATAADTYFAGRDHFLVGESLGGLVCLGMGRFAVPGLRGLIAVEPPLSYSWPLKATDLPPEIDNLLKPSCIHWLAEAHCPVTVIAGDVPLNPPRPLDHAPSVLSDAERALIADLEIVAGGHLVMSENPEACVSVILSRMQNTLAPPFQR